MLPPPDYRVRLRRGPGQGKTSPDGSRSRTPVRRLHRHLRQSQKRGTPLHHQPDCGGNAGRQIRHHSGPARAIATAIDQARLGDIVLIAGKGHENYQELSTGRIDFSDAKEVRRNMFIKEREEFPQA